MPYSATVNATGGTPSYTWSATGLPATFGINSGTGVITGNPTTTSSSQVSVKVTDSSNPAVSVTKTFTLTIQAGVSVTTTSLPNGVAGSAYNSGPLAAAGGTGPYTWSASNLPQGFSIDSNSGAISGNPASASTTNVTVTATDSTPGTHLTATKQLELKIVPKLAIATQALPSGAVGSPYNAAMASTGGQTPLTWSAPSLPGGLTINSGTGAITGVPSAGGTTSVTITVTDSTSPTHQTASVTLQLSINAAVTITTQSIPAGVVGSPYDSGALTASGGTPSYTWSASGLPAGFNIDSATGRITGTSSSPINVPITVTATDSTPGTSLTASKQFQLVISPPFVITTATLPDGQVGVAYNAPLAASGGTGQLTWSATGLPGTLTINSSTGVITGTPTTAQNVSTTITATDSTQRTAQKSLAFTIKAAAPKIATASLPAGQVGQAYGPVTVTATGGAGTLTWSMTGQPSGLTITAAGAISGVPTASGAFQVTLTVSDTSSPVQTDSKTLPLTISPAAPPPLAIATASLPNGTVNQQYSATVAATGGTPPYTWIQSGLPAGVNIDNTGLISGIPTVTGSYNPTITVRDSTNLAVSKDLPFMISGATGVITVSSATVGKDLQAPLTITLSPAPAADVSLTLTSSSPGTVTLGSSAQTGAATLTATIPAGTSTVSTYAKALSSLGTANVTAQVNGYSNGVGVVTLARSGFVVAGPNGVGGNFDTAVGANTTLTVYAALLDGSGLFVQPQQLRGGLSASVPISSSTTTVGTVSTSTVLFDNNADAVPVTFKAINGGATTISVQTPSGFTVPSAGTSLTANVTPTVFVPFSDVTVGKNLQTTATVRLGPPAVAVVDIPVTITSGDPTKLKFGAVVGGVATPSNAITVTIPQNQSATPEFFVYGLDSVGSVPYTISAPGYGSINSTVPLAPSGLVIRTPQGYGNDFTTNTAVGDATLEVWTARMSGGTVAELQSLMVGQNLSVTVTSNNAAVGTITTSPITITGGSGSAATAFHPVGGGPATITASGTGFTSGQVHATVSTTFGTVIVTTPEFPTGQFLEQQGAVILPAAAPQALQVTLHTTSNLLRLAANATDVGTDTLLLNIPAGGSSATYYMQALGSSGSPTYTASAPGYTDGTGTVQLSPSGITILPPTATTRVGFPVNMQVYTTQLSASGAPGQFNQPLAGFASLTVSLSNSNPGVGSAPSSVTINRGSTNAIATFTASSTGGTQISVNQPASWTTPTSLTYTGITVNP